MLAVAGLWGVEPRGASEALLKGLARVGRDDASAHGSGPTFAVYPQLAQAARSRDTIVAADLRLDYREELAEQLSISASEAKSVNDAELLLRAWERWGLHCVHKLEGDFAAAIYDMKGKRLILARDATGQRALHYTAHSNSLAFATTPVPLGRWLGRLEPDLHSLATYLMILPDHSFRSFIAGVERLAPGHLLVATAPGRFHQERWWKPDLTFVDLSFRDAVDAVQREVDRGVQAMLHTPASTIAAQLSGGLDSSLVVATAARHMRSDKSLVAITSDPAGSLECDPGTQFTDEADRAAETVAMLPGVRHVRVRTKAESPMAAVERWLPLTQRPFPNACNFGWVDATYAAARAAGATQMLTGTLGNGTFSYSGGSVIQELAYRGQWSALAREVRHARDGGATWLGIGGMIGQAYVPTLVAKLVALRRREETGEWVKSLMLQPRSSQLREASRTQRKAHRKLVRLYGRSERAAAERFTHLQGFDVALGAVGARASSGIELRDPTGTRRMVELCLRLPEDHFRKDGEPRRLARALLQGKVPDRVVSERRSGSQGSSWRGGFEIAQAEMLEEVEAIDPGSGLARLLDVPRMRATLLAWPTSKWEDPAQVQLYRYNLMRAIGAARFVRWLREGAPGA